METCWLTYSASAIHYYRFGRGSHLLVCLHGYGESGRSFAYLEALAGEKYTIIAPDLPYHGHTNWQEQRDLEPGELAEILNRIPGIDLHHGKFSLLGYSLGGRMALDLYSLYPENTDRVILVAPDGLKLNFWYWLATQTSPGNALFRFTMRRPGWFMGLLNMANKLGWLNPSVIKFVHRSVDDREEREELYRRWTNLRKIRPRLPYIKKLILRHATPFRLFYGKHDRIILPVRGKKFCQGVEAHCRMQILEGGHQLLQSKFAAPVLQALGCPVNEN